MLLSEIVETSAAVGGTAARSFKIERLAETLRRCEPAEASICVAYLSSQLRQRQIGVGYAAIRDLPEPAAEPALTLTEVDAALEEMGALAGLMHEALARAIGAAVSDVRRAVMLRGDFGAVAEAARRSGPVGLEEFRLQVGQPVKPMLAQSATSISAALERVSPAAIEWKLDGARVQIH